ncbi:MAG: site-2 protease family protein [Actinomycetota bacterium]
MGGFTIARVKGIPVRIDLSLILIGFFFFVLPATRAPSSIRTGAIVESVLLMVAVFGTIFLHELGHAFVAMREKMHIHNITLWALGGFATISGGRPTPGPHFRVAVGGPVVTAVLAVVLPVVARVLFDGDITPPDPASVLAQTGSLQLWLLAFNLIPAYPLDGGRMFHTALWAYKGNLTWASNIAGAVGKAFGMALVGLAVISFLRLDFALPAFLQIDPLFAVLLGFMIYSGAKNPPVMPMMHPPDGAVVGDFMVRDFVVCEPGMKISDLLDSFRRVTARPTALVLTDGAPVGMITKSVALDVAEDARETTSVSQVMIPKEQIRTVDADEPVSKAREAIEHGADTAVVLHNDVVVGLVSVSDVARAIVLEEPGAEPV